MVKGAMGVRRSYKSGPLLNQKEHQLHKVALPVALLRLVP